MILGNHCTYYKNTNKINSPELLLDKYENFTVYTEAEEIKLGSKTFLMLPWINKENQNNVLNILETSNANVLCGHLELAGFEMTPGLMMDHGMDRNLFHRFNRVWSGHYHHKSKHGNIQYLGNPYQIYWNDYKDQRGFHIYDTETDRLRFIKNPFEIFQKVYYNDLDNDYSNFDVDSFKDNFVKIIDEEKRSYTQFEDFVEKLYRTGVHDVKIVETLVDIDAVDDVDLDIKDTLTLLSEYIDEIDLSVDKTDLKKLILLFFI